MKLKRGKKKKEKRKMFEIYDEYIKNHEKSKQKFINNH